MPLLTAALARIHFIPYLTWAAEQCSRELRLDGPNFVRRDGKVILKTKSDQGGMRDLRAGFVELATLAQAFPQAHAALLIRGARMSASGIEAEWRRLSTLLTNDLRGRIGLVAILDQDEVVVEPKEAPLTDIAACVRAMGQSEDRTAQVDRSFEVMRVLLSRWLTNQSYISINDLKRQTGLSYPTVAKGLAALGTAVERHTDRSVRLRSWPQERWAQLLAISADVRQTVAYVDESGRGTSPQRLLDRITRLSLPQVAVGGVVAGRVWHPDLDLHGLPRVDLTVHTPDGALDRSFGRHIDATLGPCPAGTPPLLVVHAVPRAESLFYDVEQQPLLIADPVETLLDLLELRLVEQADVLIHHLKRSENIDRNHQSTRAVLPASG